MRRYSLMLSLCAAVTVPALAGDPAPAAKAPAKDAARPAADPAMDAMMQAWMKAATPGPQHQLLASFAGDWNLTVKSMMDPTKAPEVSKGTASIKPIMGGRFFQEEVTGTAMGQPFHGMGISGYDNLKKKYVSAWVDTMGTMIMNSTGDADAAGKVLTFHSEYIDAMTGKLAKVRMIHTVESADRHLIEFHGPGMDGKEMKTMEITYERAKMAGATNR